MDFKDFFTITAYTTSRLIQMYFTQCYTYSIERNLCQIVKLRFDKVDKNVLAFYNRPAYWKNISRSLLLHVSHKCVCNGTKKSLIQQIYGQLISYFSGRSPNITPLNARARGTEFWSANSTKANRVGCVSSPAIRTNLTSPTCLKNSSSWSAVVV